MNIFVVVDPLLSKEDSWEYHIAAILQGYADSIKDISSDNQVISIEQVTDISSLKAKFETKFISDEDVFVISNAWASSLPIIKSWADMFNCSAKFIGFRTGGNWLPSSPDFNDFDIHDTWQKLHETTLSNLLDKSLFIDEIDLKNFHRIVTKKKFVDKLHVSPFPLDYLDIELEMYYMDSYKKEMIIFPWAEFNIFHERMFYDFLRVFKSPIQAIWPQENARLDRHLLMPMIAKSKIAFLPYDVPNIGKEIYECLILETITLVPDFECFRHLVPDEFRYPAHWTKNMMSYTKHISGLYDMIGDLLLNYDTFIPVMQKKREELYNMRFNSTGLIQHVFDVA
jgi:hypothetical protein